MRTYDKLIATIPARQGMAGMRPSPGVTCSGYPRGATHR